MNRIFQDLKFAIGYFAANPLYAFILVLTLALGIGPNTVIFTILDSVYFKPLPYEKLEKLVLLNEVNLASASLVGANPRTLQVWQAHSRTLEGMAAYRSVGFHVNLLNRPDAFPGQFVSERFFRILGVSPALGRDFRAEDFVEGPPRVTIISHSLWKDYFSGRDDIVGMTIRLNGNPATVIGVMSPEFRSFMEGRVARLWVPHVPVFQGAPDQLEGTGVVARLRAGATIEQVRAELDSISGELKHQFPDFYSQRAASVRDFGKSQFTGLGPGITMLSTMVGLVLLIACGNAANLMLARSVARGKEIGIRIALGASRARLVRQMLTENLLISLAGGAVGLFFAFWGVDFLWARFGSLFQDIGAERFQIDQRVLFFTLAISSLTTLLFGALPAWRCSRVQPNSVIRGEGEGGDIPARRNRLSRFLVVFQVTLCMTCLLGTVLMVKSFLHFAELSGNPGFRTQGLLLGSVPFEQGAPDDGEKWRQFCSELQNRADGMVGVQKTALTDRLPFLDAGTSVSFVKEDFPTPDTPKQEKEIQAQAQRVSSGYFEVFAIPLIAGRPISNLDTHKSLPVVVVNETLARAYWENSDPLGQRILIDGQWKTIVGIASNPVRESPFSPSPRQIYLPYLQSPAAAMKVVVYSNVDPSQLISTLREQLRFLNPDQPLIEIRTMESALSRFMIPFRLILSLMISFGLIALALAGVGLYGVVSQMVAVKTREIGIRVALGAPREKLLSMILIQGIRLAAFGLLLGLLFGMALLKVLPSRILGVASLSPIYFLVISGALCLLAALACLVPAHRAASVDPIEVLRHG